MSLRSPHANHMEKRALEKCGTVANATKTQNLNTANHNIIDYISRTAFAKLNIAYACVANQKVANQCTYIGERLANESVRQKLI